MTTEPKHDAEGFASAASIPPMPDPPVLYAGEPVPDGWGYARTLESWGRAAQAEISSLASRLEAAQDVVEALNPGEEDPLTVARRLKRERVGLGTAINRLAQALGWPSITPDRPFAEQTVDVALERLALAGGLAEALEKGRRILNCYRGSQTAFDALLSDFDAALAKFHSSRPQA